MAEADKLSGVSRPLRIVESASGGLAALAIILMLLLCGLTILDVGLRWFFNYPISGLNEIMSATIAVAIAACFPATGARDHHLRIDFVIEAMPARVQGWLTRISSVLLLLWLGLLTWRLAVYGLLTAQRGQTLTTLPVPLAWFLYGAAICLGFATFVQIVRTLRMFGMIDEETGQVRALPTVIGLAAIVVLAIAAGSDGTWEFLAHHLLPSDPLTVAALMFAVILVAVLIGLSVGAALGLAGLIGATGIIGFEPSVTVVGSGTAEYALSGELGVLPLFVLMGAFASEAGLSGDLYRLANCVLGWVRGGLAFGTIGASAAFGSLTGSSIATAATIGHIALPEMQARGYSKRLAAGSVAAGGTLGQLVPPSTAAILYAVLTEQSIGRVYIGMIIPALITVVLYFCTVSLIVRVTNQSAEPAPFNMAEFKTALSRSWILLVVFVAMFGGIYLGVFTVTEAAAIGASLTFLVAVARGRINRESFWRTMISATLTTGMIYLLIFGAAIFSFFVSLSGLPNAITTTLSELNVPPVVVILGLLGAYLVLGCIMDSFAVMVVTIPITSVLVASMGYDLVWWGILMVCVIETGMLTPPFGLNCMVLKGISEEISLADVYRGVIPFVAADVIKLLLLVFIPWLVLWLPSTMLQTSVLR